MQIKQAFTDTSDSALVVHVIDHRCWVLHTLAGVAPITAKRDIIHKTGSTSCSTTPSRQSMTEPRPRGICT